MLREEPVQFESVKVDADVVRLLASHVKQKSLVVDELSVVWIIAPCDDLDTVAWLPHKVLPDVVNDDDF